MNISPALKQRIAELDARLPKLAKPILVLKYLNWPNATEEAFLAGWRAGRPALPVVEHQVPDWTNEITALDDFVQSANGDDPILQFLRRTAWSATARTGTSRARRARTRPRPMPLPPPVTRAPVNGGAGIGSVRAPRGV